MPLPAPENANYACTGALIDELVRAGVTSLCLCPGSRSTPLAMSGVRHGGLRVWTLIDERSMGYFALGMARMSGRPVAVLTTSGTAAANLLPAVVEARYGRVPLIVLTADRPRRLRDAAAPQTIDQVRLYGTHVKWFADAVSPQADDAVLRYYRTAACRAAALATAAPPGPVHLNVPLDEPLVPVPDGIMPAEERRDPQAWYGRPGGRPYARSPAPALSPHPEETEWIAEFLARTPRGVIIAGPQYDEGLPAVLARLAAKVGYPILADPLSQVRCGPHDRRLVIDAYDPLLRVEEAAPALAPDVIIRVGGVPASKPLLGYIERHARARQVLVDPTGWTDPSRVASDVVRCDPRRWCEAVAAVTGGAASADNPWTARWVRLSALAADAAARRLDEIDEPFEGKALAELAGLLPDGTTLFAGNSMPVRDLDSFFRGTPRALRMLGNRGASGIDGVVSSALGAAAAAAERSPGRGHEAGPGPGRVVPVLGDLSLYHDLNGLLAAKAYRLDATIVLLNNNGGGIFSFLPQAAYPGHFEALFGTPTGLDFRAGAELYGAAFASAETWPAFRREVRASFDRPGVSIVELRTARDRNVVLHREIWAAVRTAVLAELPRLARPGEVP
jgi:2-succinyl-5-enolpyruvyl-6-hydroxy-3-cyclohexene-1-carboxylate synthase